MIKDILFINRNREGGLEKIVWRGECKGLIYDKVLRYFFIIIKVNMFNKVL